MKDRGSWEENKTICSYQLKLKQIYHSIMGFSIGQDTLQYKHFQNAKTITQITHTQHSLRTSKVMDWGREQNFAFRMLFQQTKKTPNNKNPNEKLIISQQCSEELKNSGGTVYIRYMAQLLARHTVCIDRQVTEPVSHCKMETTPSISQG